MNMQQFDRTNYYLEQAKRLGGVHQKSRERTAVRVDNRGSDDLEWYDEHCPRVSKRTQQMLERVGVDAVLAVEGRELTEAEYSVSGAQWLSPVVLAPEEAAVLRRRFRNGSMAQKLTVAVDLAHEARVLSLTAQVMRKLEEAGFAG